MPRELDGYRDLLERLDGHFPGKEMLTQREVMEFTGWSRYKILRHISDNPVGIPKTVLARKLLRPGK